jgi:hypothetical protein
MNIFLGDLNVKVDREDIFKPTIGKESLHEISNNNGVRLVNFVTSKNLIIKSTMFPHRNIHKHNWTSPDGNTHNQIDDILIDRRRHSNVLAVRSFRAADCDTGYEDYEECLLLGYKYPVLTSQETQYSATDPSRLMLCKT